MSMTKDPRLPIADRDRDYRATIARHRQAAASLIASVTRPTPPSPARPRKIVTLADALVDLPISEASKPRTARVIRDMVAENLDTFGVTQALRAEGLPHGVVSELIRRGRELVARSRTSAVNAVVRKSYAIPNGAGWEPVPGGKHGGWRRHKAGGGYEYAYPDDDAGDGFSRHDGPHAGESEDVHTEHDKATPRADVAAAYEKLRDRAEAAGLSLSGVPGAQHSLKHVQELEKLVTRAERQRAKVPADELRGHHEKIRAGAKAAGIADDDIEASIKDAGDDRKKVEEILDKIDKTHPLPEDEHKAVLDEIRKLGKDADVDDEDLEEAIAEVGNNAGGLQTIKDALTARIDDQTDREIEESLPPVRDDNPESRIPSDPKERQELVNHITALQASLDKMGAHMKERDDLIERLRREIELSKRRPTVARAHWVQQRVRSAAIVFLGAAAGLILGGPMGLLLGLTMADRTNRVWDESVRDARPDPESIVEPRGKKDEKDEKDEAKDGGNPRVERKKRRRQAQQIQKSLVLTGAALLVPVIRPEPLIAKRRTE